MRYILLAVLGGFGVACYAVDRFGAAAVYFTMVKPLLDVPPGELMAYSLVGIVIDTVVLAGLIELARRWQRSRRASRVPAGRLQHLAGWRQWGAK